MADPPACFLCCSDAPHVQPVHPKLPEIEGLAVKQLKELAKPEEWGVSVVTPPAATLDVLKEARALGFKRFWLQPGAENADVVKEAATWKDVSVIAGGPCVLVSIDRGEHRAKSNV